MPKIPETTNTKKLSLDFIAGLVTGGGYFGWVNYNTTNQKMAVFQLRMRYNDKNLIFSVKNTLGLKESVYEYNYQDQKKPSLWRHQVLLLVRRREVIKKIIIPAFDGRLCGLKEKQFNEWKNEFFKREKEWSYRYVEKLPKGMIGTDKL